MYCEQVGEHQEGESHLMIGARHRGCPACQSQSEGVREWMETRRDAKGNGACKPSVEYKAQSQRPKPWSKYRQTLPWESKAPLLLHAGDDCREGSCLVSLLSLPSQLRNDA